MKTYATYQEAKISNPESEFYTNGEIFSAVEFNTLKHVNEWKACNPVDYCMNVEQFLNKGNEFYEGDLIIDEDGVNHVLDKAGSKLNWYSTKSSNIPDSSDYNRFVLRASALEKPKQISDTAREVMTSVKQSIVFVAENENGHSESEPFTLSITEPKYRYEKVTESIFDLKDELERGELYNESLDCSGDFVVVKSETVLLACGSTGNLYRRVEISERDLFIEKMSRYATSSVLGKMFDDGCRVIE